MKEIEYSEDDYQLINSLEESLHNSLVGEIIPSLRGIILKLKPGEKTACINFYHGGQITNAIESHYLSIIENMKKNYVENPYIFNYKIIRCDPPEKVPNEHFIIHKRKEPFKDPIDE